MNEEREGSFWTEPTSAQTEENKKSRVESNVAESPLNELEKRG